MALALLLTAGIAPVVAAEWRPARTVEFVVPAAAGGGPDVLARMLQRIATEQRLLDVQVSVLNRPGGNHTLAWSQLQQNPGDSHVLMMASLGLLTSSLSGANTIDYTEGTMIVQLYAEHIAFAVNADSALRSGRDAVERLRKDPGSLTFATGGDGAGGANHLAVAQAMKAAGVDLRRLRVVQYQASAQSTTALLGNHVDIVAAPPASLLPHVQSGRLRIIAVSSPTRSRGVFSEVPTWRELGVNAVFSNVRGVIGPRGVPVEQVRFWEDLFARLARTESWQASLEANHRSGLFLGATEADKSWRALNAELRSLLTDLGLARQ